LLNLTIFSTHNHWNLKGLLRTDPYHLRVNQKRKQIETLLFIFKISNNIAGSYHIAYTVWIIGVSFTQSGKASIRFISVRSSICVHRRCSYRTDFSEIWYWGTY
jgi:hypothetical protein